jgi:hypothetical protein
VEKARQLRAEALAGTAWIFTALAGVVGEIRRMLLRITANEPRQTWSPDCQRSTGTTGDYPRI